MKSKQLTLMVSFIVAIAMSVMFYGCSCSSKFPSQFVGKWADQINRNQRVEITIKKNGEYKLKIIETNKRQDIAYYSGTVVKVNDEIIKLPSTSYMRDHDNVTTFVQVNSTFFLRSDGAFSRSEADLNRPYGYLVKLNDY